MELIDFEKELKTREGVPITKNIILFNDYELVFMDDKNSVKFNSFNEVLKYKVDEKTIEELINEMQSAFLSESGGRGSSSMPSGSLFAGQEGNERTGGVAKPLSPAYINALTSQRYKSIEETTKAFGKSLAGNDGERSGVIDLEGYAVEYVKGGKTSTPHLERENQYSIHNHPVKALAKQGIKGYNAPSRPDLTNWATGRGKGTIITADGNRTAYIISKSNNFSAKKFIKGMRDAKGRGNYDRDVDNFLRNNQRALNYKYKKIKY